MITQNPSKTENTQIMDDQGIRDLYQKLGIETEEKKDDANRCIDFQRGYWPPIPEYSVRFCTDEDLNY